MKKLTTMMCAAAMTAGAFAQELDDTDYRTPTPLDFGFCSALKLPPFERDVWGLKLNILHSRELDIYGLDMGFIGCNTGNVVGWQDNVFNWVDGHFYGVQIGGVGNYVTGNAYGIQIAGLLTWNLADTYGVQISTLNFDATFTGLEIGALNWNAGGTDGMQIGVANVELHDAIGSAIGCVNFTDSLLGGQIGLINLVSGHGRGFQLGIANAAESFCGVQIGVVNVNITAPLPMMVVANANF